MSNSVQADNNARNDARDDDANNRVIVVGAGLVGAVQALLLARSGYKVTLIEQRRLRTSGITVEEPAAANKKPLVNEKTGANRQSGRTVVLSNRSWQLLDAVGLWPDLECCSVKTVHVTEQGKYGSVRLQADELDVDALGYVLSNELFEYYLHDRLRSEPSIEVIESASVVDCEKLERSARLTVDCSGTEKSIDATLVVAADGTGSSVRSMLGIETEGRDYQQCAVLTTIETTASHNNTAFERFTEDGPLALLPTGISSESGRPCYSLILTAPAAESARLQQISEEEFLQLVQRKFGGRLGRFQTLGSRFIVPLKLTVSERQVDQRYVLIGNAARTLHPVAGQGLNLALRDVFELASCLNGGDVDIALDEFAKRRKRDQWLITRQTDLLARAFSARSWLVRTPVSLLSGASFLLLDFLDPVKKAFASMNMGRHVPLPDKSIDHPNSV